MLLTFLKNVSRSCLHPPSSFCSCSDRLPCLNWFHVFLKACYLKLITHYLTMEEHTTFEWGYYLFIWICYLKYKWLLKLIKGFEANRSPHLHLFQSNNRLRERVCCFPLVAIFPNYIWLLKAQINLRAPLRPLVLR